jgi:5-(carboxyamino)imidazole ribonucleotide mutase
MPKGVPVATVAIDGAENAALLAVQILSVKDVRLREAMRSYKSHMAREIEAADAAFREERGE